MCSLAPRAFNPESLSISYPDLIKFHYFADDNRQEGMKHQMRGETQAQDFMDKSNILC